MLEDAAGIRRVVLACGFVDLRKGIDGLAQIVGARYDLNPFVKGTLFLFCGRRSDRIKGLLCADRPKDLLRNSILTPSLGAAVINAKYVNSLPLYRIEQEFNRNGISISRQTLADWVIKCAQRYLIFLYDHLHGKLLACPVNQADETPVEVIHDRRNARSKSYMWVHRSGEMYREQPMH